MRRENRAVIAYGMTGCGKSKLLWDWFTSQHPRVLTYDPVGDTLDRNPHAVAVRTAHELREHLRRVVAGKFDGWHFVMYGEPEEAADALDALAPAEIAPNQRSLCRLLGGVLFESGEIDTLASNAATPLSRRIAGKFQRGRHNLLSMAVATQAPALVSRSVSANCHDHFAFMHAEATSLEYFRRTIGDHAAERIARLKQYEFLHYHRGDASCTVYSAERTPIDEIPLGIRQ